MDAVMVIDDGDHCAVPKPGLSTEGSPYCTRGFQILIAVVLLSHALILLLGISISWHVECFKNSSVAKLLLVARSAQNAEAVPVVDDAPLQQSLSAKNTAGILHNLQATMANTVDFMEPLVTKVALHSIRTMQAQLEASTVVPAEALLEAAGKGRDVSYSDDAAQTDPQASAALMPEQRRALGKFADQSINLLRALLDACIGHPLKGQLSAFASVCMDNSVRPGRRYFSELRILYAVSVIEIQLQLDILKAQFFDTLLALKNETRHQLFPFKAPSGSSGGELSTDDQRALADFAAALGEVAQEAARHLAQQLLLVEGPALRRHRDMPEPRTLLGQRPNPDILEALLAAWKQTAGPQE